VDATTIAQRIRLGEGSRTELKSAARGLEAKVLARTVSAFANARGGQIFVGVEDDSTLTGVGTVSQADTLMLQVVQMCQTMIRPAIWCPITKVEVDGKLLVVVDVPASSPDRPYRAEHTFYIRDASMTRETTREELLRLLRSQNVYHDESPLGGAGLDDLDTEAVDSYLRALYEPSALGRREQYLRSLRCLDEDGVPTVAGILLFGRDPQRWIPDARISAARFNGTAVSSEFADRKDIGGTLLQQLDHASVFLPTPAGVSGFERVERGIPEVVLREALVNALAHRDYRAASQVRLFVFADRVEIINPGILLNHLTLDSIRLGGISVRRNPVLASLLSRARRSESAHLGVPEMTRRMRERGLPGPEISAEGGHFRVVLRVRHAEAARGTSALSGAARDAPPRMGWSTGGSLQ
jgi:ATP-dependent DNA helicase RecG